MEQRRYAQWLMELTKYTLLTALLVFDAMARAQIQYAISEDQKDGSAVGNIAKDLGIDHRSLKERGFRIVSNSGESMFSVNQNDGVLYVNGEIDREEVCERSTPCLINLKIALENPLEIHYIIVEILDVNDHAPSFPESQMNLEIGESALPGARFQLQAARDSDSGSNSVHQYKLGHNDNFRLEVKDRGEDGKIPILILQKPIDRELTRTINLHITALDGGKPAKSGTMDITINVIDINDNVPVFTKDIYSVMLNENAPIGTTVIQVNATDFDEGSNGEVVYSFGKNVNSKVRKLFDINTITGEITVEGPLDYEDKDSYEIDIQASDRGTVPHRTDKSIMIQIIDINDNEPEIEVTSFSSAIPEDSRPVSDVKNTVKDEEENNVTFYLIITLGSVSVLFVISIVLIAMQCSKSTDYSSKYLQDTNYEGLCVTASKYRSGDKRYMLVGPRMSIGSTIVPGSNGNTLVIPDRRRTDSGEAFHILQPGLSISD
ncbi:hypothetical protein cypCar_00045774 [Cyprinus carpio]|nr:hypothetical protein cypCar_00045774 [Cyprinus carpio]